MSDTAADVQRLLHQQTALARFGSFAFGENDLLTVLNEAARVCAEGLGAPFCKICRYRPDEDDLLIIAGHGWKPGIVGVISSQVDSTSPQGRAFSTGEPSIFNDIRLDSELALSAFYADHNIVSAVDVVIRGAGRPYGILEIDSDIQHDYDQQDIEFLTGFANVLSQAVATATRTGILQTTILQMKSLVDDKNRLLAQKSVLAEELQHRVRNNLQIVHGMLSLQIGTTTDPGARRGIQSIAHRVFTLGQIYDHLLGAEMTRTTDFGRYLAALCANLTEIHGAKNGCVTLTCEGCALYLDLDMVTALGVVVAEIITNSFEHAFPAGAGSIHAALQQKSAKAATLVIRDNGCGFTPAAESKRHGIGLVRRLVEQIGGTAMLQSDTGTTWTIVVPLIPLD